jgi:hypothetical protein
MSAVSELRKEKNMMASHPKIEVDPKLIETFHLMFDHFPECVQLAHKSFLVIAVNSVASIIGRDVGMICAKHGSPEAHKGCTAQKTVREHKATWKAIPATEAGKLGTVAFWLPIDGYPDFYLHFGVGVMKDYLTTQE